MTRIIVYSAALVALIAATGTTFSSILTPNWISFAVHSPSATTIRSLGLHQSCTVTTSSSPSIPSTSICRPFPSDQECATATSNFCTIWRTASFLLNLSLVLELATIVAFVVILAGGKARREVGGWKVLSGMLGVVSAVLVSGMAVVAYLFDHDEMFVVPGWRLDRGWVLCVVGGVVSALAAGGLVGSKVLLGEEGGYEILEDRGGV